LVLAMAVRYRACQSAPHHRPQGPHAPAPSGAATTRWRNRARATKFIAAFDVAKEVSTNE